MRKLVIISFAILSGLFGFQSCSLDNYEAPSATLTGTIIDSETNEPVPCQYQNGSRIRIYEFYKGDWAKQPNDFYTKQEGTFTNQSIFAGKYQVEAEGAFVAPAKAEVDVAGVTTYDIKVTPFLRLTASATNSGKSVSMTANVKKGTTGNPVKAIEFYCGNTPYVDKSTFAKKSTVDLFGMTQEQIIAATHKALFEGLISGKTYYFRVGALGENAGSYYNYSKVIEVKVP